MNSYCKDIYDILCKSYPNRNIYVISDQHFYHTSIIEYERTEFDEVQEMNNYIINCHNDVVESDDIVIFLGDFSFKGSAIKDLLKQMNGHKYLLLGNHDNERLVRCYKDVGFEDIFFNCVKIGNMYLSHYPLCNNEVEGINHSLLVREFENSGGINYHGHTHSRNVCLLSFVNVSCEAQNYRPLLIGRTKEYVNNEGKSLIINSDYFLNMLDYLKKERNLEPSLIISDYIYSTILESLNSYVDSSFVYGSFPLYKKYGCISNFSDLDVCFIYNDSLSKRKNSYLLKKSFHEVFEEIKGIDSMDLSFRKIIDNIRIFELLYSDDNGNVYKGYYDSNLVSLNVYRDSDFIKTHDCSTLEKMLKNRNNFVNDFRFPRYESRFLSINGDIANMALQMMFQRSDDKSKFTTLKKLKYICRMCNCDDMLDVDSLDDTMTRFFIRNVMFFHTMRRSRDIDYINQGYDGVDDFIIKMPYNLKSQMEEVFKNSNSLFNSVYNELSGVSFNEIPDVSKQLIKTIK